MSSIHKDSCLLQTSIGTSITHVQSAQRAQHHEWVDEIRGGGEGTGLRGAESPHQSSQWSTIGVPGYPPSPPPPTPLNSEIERSLSREALCLHLKVCCSTLLDATVRQKKHFVCFCFLCGGNLLRGAFKELVSIIIQPLSSTQEFQIIFI